MDKKMNSIRDCEGNRFALFDESFSNEDSLIGDNLADFEILLVLNEKPCVYKVRSLKNDKIYAMKKIEVKSLKNSNSQAYIEFMDKVNKLKEINNSHIIKYYNSFIFKDNLYLVMEYMNNSDIYDFIKTYQLFNKNIEEEVIWNLLLQCLSALDYLYKEDYGSSGIRINNIYMNNEQSAKLSIFDGYDKKNEEKSDINLLGQFFYSMCFSRNKRVTGVESLKDVTIVEENNQNYSNELMEIIYEMTGFRQNKPFNLLYEQFKNEFSKKFDKNSSIECICRCLYSFQNLNSSILKNEKKFIKGRDKYYISNWYIKIIKALNGEEEDNLKLCMEEFRMAVTLENSMIDNKKEIDPLYFLAFILMKIHTETKPKNEIDINERNPLGKDLVKSMINGEEEDKSNKKAILQKYSAYYKEAIKSLIAELFFGFLKNKRICYICKTGNYSYSDFFFVNFDLSQTNSKKDFDLINDGFALDWKKNKNDPVILEKVFCKRCLADQPQIEFNQYFMMGHQLIISFIRGKDFKNETNIDFKETLNLKDYVESQNSPKEYYLVGSINRTYSKEDGNEKYVYYCRDPVDYNKWYLNETSEKYDCAPIEEIKKNGQIILLFYNNSEIKPNNSK